jgi:hypothetical protein
MSLPSEYLPQIRFDILEAARILRISRAMLYERIKAGENQNAKGWPPQLRHRQRAAALRGRQRLTGHLLTGRAGGSALRGHISLVAGLHVGRRPAFHNAPGPCRPPAIHEARRKRLLGRSSSSRDRHWLGQEHGGKASCFGNSCRVADRLGPVTTIEVSNVPRGGP